MTTVTAQREEHWPYQPGEEVWVNSKGPGIVEELYENKNPISDRIKVRITNSCSCDHCGNKHTAVEHVTIHPMHVSYTMAERERQGSR